MRALGCLLSIVLVFAVSVAGSKADEIGVKGDDGSDELLVAVKRHNTIQLPPSSFSVASQDQPIVNAQPQRAPTSQVDSGRDEIIDMFCRDGVRDLCQTEILMGQLLELRPVAAAPGAPPVPRLTMAMIQEAFAEVPVPASSIVVEPPGGETLVNLPTIFSTEAVSFVESLVLLGYAVDLRISPSSYSWVHGDGTTQTTDGPGRAWQRNVDMGDYVTHMYEQTKAGLRVRVDVTWAADFRVDGGPWQTVPGTVTITGPAEPLDVREADPLLVGTG